MNLTLFRSLTLAVACVCFTTSCYTTSISNPGATGHGGYPSGNALYGGELDGLDVLGVETGDISESAIRAALGKSSGKSVRIRRGERILLVQSGASHPDASLQTAMGRYYEVVPFSELPLGKKGKDRASASKRLRMAAAQAGVHHVVVVWGTLETSVGDLPSKAVNDWLPIVGEMVTDEKKATRIVTTAAVIETSTGAWRSVSSEPKVRTFHSSGISRTAKWARQVETLKTESYPDLAQRVAAF